jgi:hypothetical protein
MTQSRSIEIPDRVRKAAFVLTAAGVIAAIYGVISDPVRAWPTILLTAFFITTLPVCHVLSGDAAAHRRALVGQPPPRA